MEALKAIKIIVNQNDGPWAGARGSTELSLFKLLLYDY